MLYGYDEVKSGYIGEFLGTLMGSRVEVISGTGMEDHIVQDIIEGGAGNTFKDGNPKILMFLGFDSEEIENVLASFPKDVPRPIFCDLTESNIVWRLAMLIEHLLEEKRYWAQQQTNSAE